MITYRNDEIVKYRKSKEKEGGGWGKYYTWEDTNQNKESLHLFNNALDNVCERWIQEFEIYLLI